MLAQPSTRTVLLVVGLLALALSACGRRGALEAPPSPAALRQASQPQGPVGRNGRPAGAPSQGTPAPADPVVEEEEDSLLPDVLRQPSQTSDPQRRRNYTIPKQPFILDPLL